jgi:hypothetical protein
VRPLRNWRVFRVSDAGERLATVSEPLDQEAAQKLAGRLRDEMSDAEVGAGVNYIAEETLVKISGRYVKIPAGERTPKCLLCGCSPPEPNDLSIVFRGDR